MSSKPTGIRIGTLMLASTALHLIGVSGYADTTPSFTIKLMGSLPGGTASSAWDLTRDGDVVGRAATNGANTPHAFLWDAATTTMADLGTLTGVPSDESIALGISSDEHTAGNSDQFGTLEKNGFYYPSGGPILPVLPPPPGYRDPNAQDIEFVPGWDPVHRIVGWSTHVMTGSPHASHWDFELGSAISLGTMTGDMSDWSRAYGVNTPGEIVGFSTRGPLPGHAFIWRGAGMIDIDQRPDGGDSFAFGINNSSQVVGFFYSSWMVDHTACRYDERWDGWRLKDLGCLSETEILYATAHDISDGALIAGWSEHPSPDLGRTATMWLNDEIYDLNTIVQDSPIYLVEATGVNLAGQIVGYGWGEDWREQAFRLDPATLMMMQPVSGDAGKTNDLHGIGATAGAQIYFVYGFRSGSTRIPGCGGAVVDIANPTIVGSATADALGVASLAANVPMAARDRTILMQAVDPASCAVSNLVTYTFQ